MKYINIKVLSYKLNFLIYYLLQVDSEEEGEVVVVQVEEPASDSDGIDTYDSSQDTSHISVVTVGESSVDTSVTSDALWSSIDGISFTFIK